MRLCLCRTSGEGRQPLAGSEGYAATSHHGSILALNMRSEACSPSVQIGSPLAICCAATASRPAHAGGTDSLTGLSPRGLSDLNLKRGARRMPYRAIVDQLAEALDLAPTNANNRCLRVAA